MRGRAKVTSAKTTKTAALQSLLLKVASAILNRVQNQGDPYKQHTATPQFDSIEYLQTRIAKAAASRPSPSVLGQTPRGAHTTEAREAGVFQTDPRHVLDYARAAFRRKLASFVPFTTPGGTRVEQSTARPHKSAAAIQIGQFNAPQYPAQAAPEAKMVLQSLMKPNLAPPAGANVTQPEEPLPGPAASKSGIGMHANKLPGHAAIGRVVQKQRPISASGDSAIPMLGTGSGHTGPD